MDWIQLDWNKVQLANLKLINEPSWFIKTDNVTVSYFILNYKKVDLLSDMEISLLKPLCSCVCL